MIGEHTATATRNVEGPTRLMSSNTVIKYSKVAMKKLYIHNVQRLDTFVWRCPATPKLSITHFVK